jgi:hypothetical protein
VDRHYALNRLDFDDQALIDQQVDTKSAGNPDTVKLNVNGMLPRYSMTHGAEARG